MPSCAKAAPVDFVDSLVLSTQAAAKCIGVSYTLLTHDRAKGKLGVPFCRIGDRIVYRKSDLLAWLETRVTVPTPRAKPVVRIAREPARPNDPPRSGRPTRAEQAAAASAGFATVAAYRQHQRQLTAVQGGAA